MRFRDQTADSEREAERYLAREPEALVIDGYRGWLSFAVDRDVAKLDAIWSMLNRSLDRHCARFAMSGLEGLIRQLGVCATCPLWFHCQGTKHLCRDECLILALVSGLQNGDDEAARLSAASLAAEARAGEILAAASEFAMALKISGKQLLPIHLDVVRMIVESGQKPQQTALH